jgi:hypothetical protein
MTGAILASVVVAFVAGAITGFGKGWAGSLLFSALIVPAVFALLAWIWIPAGWALLTCLWSILAAFPVWGVAAGLNYIIRKVVPSR